MLYMFRKEHRHDKQKNLLQIFASYFNLKGKLEFSSTFSFIQYSKCSSSFCKHLLSAHASNSSVVHWLLVLMKYTLKFSIISTTEVHRGKHLVIPPFTQAEKLLIQMLFARRETVTKPPIFTMQGNIRKINFQMTGYSESKETHKDDQVQLLNESPM